MKDKRAEAERAKDQQNQQSQQQSAEDAAAAQSNKDSTLGDDQHLNGKTTANKSAHKRPEDAQALDENQTSSDEHQAVRQILGTLVL